MTRESDRKYEEDQRRRMAAEYVDPGSTDRSQAGVAKSLRGRSEDEVDGIAAKVTREKWAVTRRQAQEGTFGRRRAK